jgi:hypothetical protein
LRGLRIGDAVFVGDTLFMPDYGTARCDFPGGSARALWRSIRRLLDLPPETRVFTAHDHKAPGRDGFAWGSTVAEQRARNPHVKDGTTEEEFVALREARDATLAPPPLLVPSIQVNMRAGRFPPAESNGALHPHPGGDEGRAFAVKAGRGGGFRLTSLPSYFLTGPESCPRRARLGRRRAECSLFVAVVRAFPGRVRAGCTVAGDAPLRPPGVPPGRRARRPCCGP